MTFFCNKCGYSGPVAYPHAKNGVPGSGDCGYEAVLLPPMTDEEKNEIMKRFGLDIFN